ncbi:MAG: cation:proton antiporter, partial [Pseudomonadota bacterium]
LNWGWAEVNAETLRHMTRAGLAFLVFLAAQQCRISRLISISKPVFWLGILGIPFSLLLYTMTAFVILPGLTFWGILIVASALILGGALTQDHLLLEAPVERDTKRAARLEGAMTLLLGLPLALLLEKGSSPVMVGTPIHLHPLFLSVAGFTVGGAIGLLSGRFLPLSPQSPLPVLPFLVAAFTYALSLLLGLDSVMAALGAGLLFSEEAKIPGPVRTNLWRTGERFLRPLALIAFGYVLMPLMLKADFLIWIVATVIILVVRPLSRFIILQTRGDLALQDRTFLTWFGGAPGVGCILFLLSLMASPAAMLEDTSMALATAIVVVGLVVTRLFTKPLTTRLVQETARARKKKYRPA